MQERILETADRLFYFKGIRAIGVDTIAAEIGISKRTLYNYYKSKDALVLAYLTRRLRINPHTDAPPAQQILGDFERLERHFASDAFRGCPFVNAVAEIGGTRQGARKIAIAFKEQRRLWFRELLARAGLADPDGLAFQLALLVDGAVAGALVRGDPMMARHARNAAETLLRGAGIGMPPAPQARRKSTHA